MKVEHAVTEVVVSVGRPYRVLVGAGALAELGRLVTEPRVAVITDANVAGTHAAAALAALSSGPAGVQLFQVAPGEASKDLATYGALLRDLAAAGFGRDAAVVAVGGGVVTDLAGFVAATYLRGVAFYSCPTSLLAMVDAGVGGKTGINLPEGKNLVGAFWQPRAVVADVETLATLPEREFRQGAVESFKHGLLGAPELLGALDDPQFRPGGDPSRLRELVASSVRVKARVVADDEREAGARAHLNLGHTLAHALEAASGHALAHGDAVAYGLLFAALLARRRGWDDLTPEVLRLLEYVRPAGLPTREYGQLLPYLERDKKNRGGGQRFVLLRRLGEPVLVEVTVEEQSGAWVEFLELVG